MNESDTAGLIDQQFKRKFLERHGLPDIPYPITIQGFHAAISNPTEPAFAEMLFALQLRSMAGSSDWMSLEPAMDRLVELIMPNDTRGTVDAAGESWWLQIGPVDLAQRLVTIQRGNQLIAAISPRADGRLRIACYRPLDSKSADYLIGMGAERHPEHGVCMRENNWEYTLDCSAGMGNWYAFERGEAHLSYWEAGIGVMRDGARDSEWFQKRNLPDRQPVKVAMELGVRFSLQT